MRDMYTLYALEAGRYSRTTFNTLEEARTDLVAREEEPDEWLIDCVRGGFVEGSSLEGRDIIYGHFFDDN